MPRIVLVALIFGDIAAAAPIAVAIAGAGFVFIVAAAAAIAKRAIEVVAVNDIGTAIITITTIVIIIKHFRSFRQPKYSPSEFPTNHAFLMLVSIAIAIVVDVVVFSFFHDIIIIEYDAVGAVNTIVVKYIRDEHFR